MALTPDEIAKHLPLLVGLRDELDALITAVKRAKKDGEITTVERKRIRKKGFRLLREATPVIAGLIADILD